VPLLARGPGIKPGSVHNQPCGNVDLTPTLLTLAAGADYVPEFMDGALS
jgi:arylsulfatase A-like enzyme